MIFFIDKYIVFMYILFKFKTELNYLEINVNGYNTI